MQADKEENIKILHTAKDDLPAVFHLFGQAMELQGKNGYRVWDHLDKTVLEKDVENRLHYKVLYGNEIACVFSVRFTDPLIWGERDRDNAIYLHRIVVNPKFKGQKQFEKVLNWARQSALERRAGFIRMDTWADNRKLIDYYRSFGFRFIENYTTPDDEGLPSPNRNLKVALLQLEL